MTARRRRHDRGDPNPRRGRSLAAPEGAHLAGGLARDRRDRPRHRSRPLQPALSHDAQPLRRAARQRLYRGRRGRHVDGDHLRQYRHFDRLTDRRAGHGERHSGGGRRADRRDLAGAARRRNADHGPAGGHHCIPSHSGHRGDARHALDPQRRPDQRHRRQVDHRSAGQFPSRRYRAVRRRADAGVSDDRRDDPRGLVDALFGAGPRHLRGRRQRRGGAALRHLAAAHDRDGVRAARFLRRHSRPALRDAAPRHPVDRAAEPRIDDHHRLGGRRRQHSRRRRHGDRLDPRRGPDRRNRQRAGLYRRLALLDPRGARRAHSRDRDRRHLAAPAHGRSMSAMSEIPLAHAAKRVAPWWLLRHEAMLAAILFVALIALGLLNNRFLTLDNLLNQGRLTTEVGLIALPMTFIIVTGGIDLSVGSTVGLCAILLGYSWKTFDFPLPLAICFALFVGAAAGFLNGLVITKVRVPPLIMTIATLALYRGLAEGISQAHSVRGYPEWFFSIGQGEWLGLPAQLWILLAFAIGCWVELDRTTFGRTLYAIGNNETAARFSGLPVDRVKLIIYTLSGFMAGLSATVLVSRVTTTRSDMGSGYELDVIAAVVLGGTSIFGGVGTIWGTVVGLVMIQLLKNGLALTGVKGDATIVVIGAVLILSTLVASSLQRRRDGV